MDVTDVLRDRHAASRTGLQRMLTVSVARARRGRGAGHGRAAAACFSAPPTPPRTVMTISLGGGGDGPRQRRHDARSAAGRCRRRRRRRSRRSAKPVRPPAAKTPEMTVPLPRGQAGRSRPRRPSEAGARRGARPDADARRAGRRRATPIAETGVRGQGFGLSTGGGPGTGSSLDVGDFCCPDYIATMVERIRARLAAEPGRVAA